MSNVFDRAIETAKRLIAKNGELVAWRQIGKVRDAAKPWNEVEGLGYVDTNVRIVILPKGSDALFRLLAGTEVTTGKVQGLMAAVPFVPEKADIIISPLTGTYRIKQIAPLQPNGVPILYTLDLDQ